MNRGPNKPLVEGTASAELARVLLLFFVDAVNKQYSVHSVIYLHKDSYAEREKRETAMIGLICQVKQAVIWGQVLREYQRGVLLLERK